MIRVRVTVGGKVERELDVEGDVVVGRKEPADIVVSDGQVSSRHAVLRAAGDGLTVTDLGSTNGTRIDTNDRIPSQQATPLAVGQKLLIGPAVIEIVARAAAADSGFGKSDRTVVVGSGQMQSLLVQVARFKAAKPRLVLGAEHAKRTIEITELESVIGRDADQAQVVVPHQSVSHQHAKLRFADGKFLLEDLGSANGTFISGMKVSGTTPIEPQTALTFGTVDCLFVARAAEAGGAEGQADPLADILAAHVQKLGKATQQQARDAIAEHRSSGRTLGEIFVETGVLTPQEWAEIYKHRTVIATLQSAGSGASKRSFAKTLGILVVVLGLAALAVAAFTQGWFGGGAK